MIYQYPIYHFEEDECKQIINTHYLINEIDQHAQEAEERLSIERSQLEKSLKDKIEMFKKDLSSTEKEIEDFKKKNTRRQAVNNQQECEKI